MRTWALKKQNVEKRSVAKIRMRMLTWIIDNTLRSRIKNKYLQKIKRLLPLRIKMIDLTKTLQPCAMKANNCSS